jgi:hypothetical protein
MHVWVKKSRQQEEEAARSSTRPTSTIRRRWALAEIYLLIELLRQDRHERVVVNVRVRRLQLRRREAVDPAPAGLEQ